MNLLRKIGEATSGIVWLDFKISTLAAKQNRLQLGKDQSTKSNWKVIATAQVKDDGCLDLDENSKGSANVGGQEYLESWHNRIG